MARTTLLGRLIEALFAITVVPGARRNAIEPRPDGSLRIRVTAPAVEGKANDAVCRLLANTLGIRQRDVSIEQGLQSRRKTVRIAGIDFASLADRVSTGKGVDKRA